jgi:hypothetical protein
MPALLLAVVLAVASASPATAAPVTVRFSESVTHGFLVVKATAGGGTIAHGEFTQHPQGEGIHNQLTFRFTDGSLYDEQVTYTQRRVFRLMSYKLVQKGPSFPATEVSFDRESGRYRARSGSDTSEGKLDLPEDAHNGLTGMLLKNVPPGATASGHIMAFTPKPQLVRTTMSREGEDKFLVGDATHTATRWLVDLEIPGVKGVVAGWIGKEPPDLNYWIATGPAPGFVKFEGAMFLKGPRWRVELSGPGWPDGASRSAPPGSARRS